MFGLAPLSGAPIGALNAATPLPPAPGNALPAPVRRAPAWMLGVQPFRAPSRRFAPSSRRRVVVMVIT